MIFTQKNVACKNKHNYDITITIKNGYFYPQEKSLRNIFDKHGNKGGFWFEGAMRYDLYKGLNIETSGSYFKHDGYALCGNEKTTITIPTFGLGLKYFCPAHDKIVPFIGSGLRLFFYKEQNCSQYVTSFSKTVVGGMINAGLEFKVHNGFFIDLAFDYNIAKLKNNCCSAYFHNNILSCCPSCYNDIYIGGIIASIGIGYTF